MLEPVIIGDATLFCGDCLDVLPTLGKVDAVVTDPPYGTTACEWDNVIPLGKFWDSINNLIQQKSAIVMFCSQPFTTILISSNFKNFKYCLVWNKISKTDVMNAKNKPLKQHEDIAIFSMGTTANCSNRRMTYNPQGLIPAKRNNPQNTTPAGYMGKNPRPSHKKNYEYQNSNYPSTVLDFSNANRNGIVHPTQKPVALMKYLIATYTNESDTILDPFMGSGTTGVAALKLGRKFIGIEIDPTYFKIACDRIAKEANQLKLEFAGVTNA